MFVIQQTGKRRLEASRAWYAEVVDIRNRADGVYVDY
jgi:hypothetical protein